MMPPSAGQQISPALVQAMTNISSSDEDAQNLKTQMALAQAMRAPPLQNNAMAGKVVVKNSPLAVAANAGQNMLANYQQQSVLSQMKAQATMLRNSRGQIISDAQAHYNAANNPS